MELIGDQSLDATFAALADPTRRAILARLAQGDASVMQLAAPFAMTQPAVSSTSRCGAAGLVSRRRDAQRRPCHLEAPALRNATEWLDEYRRFWAGATSASTSCSPTCKRTSKETTREPDPQPDGRTRRRARDRDHPRLRRATSPRVPCAHRTGPAPAMASAARLGVDRLRHRPAPRRGVALRHPRTKGAEMVVHGVYREVSPPDRLVSTESFDDDWTGGESIVTSTFDEVEGVTTVTVSVIYTSREVRRCPCHRHGSRHGRGLRPARGAARPTTTCAVGDGTMTRF